jgi:hypothetical protein
MLTLKAEVRALRQRLEHIDAGMTSRHREEQNVAV